MRRLLIANRGEIARRIIATCRRLAIATVAVYSDADANAPFVTEADVAVRLPGDSARETYLRADLLVAAAQRTGADAVHPGYGFLAEDADFADAVSAAGLTWVGPPATVIRALASKLTAKSIMAAAGVPVLPQVDLTSDVPLPLLIKASAGGGGRGMRVVDNVAALPNALDSARREAAAAFGDATVFGEPFVLGARHVEVQVLADASGTVWTLGARDCSVQRRHQKIVEETPAPGLTAAVSSALTEAAVAAARAVGYLGAGTVEFLVADNGRCFFLEVNTRLQVEHPVTECVYGLDLVAWQLRIADGERLGGEPPTPTGHAVEARLYAEDPARDWAPQTGTFGRVDIPHDVAFGLTAAGPSVRLDSAVESNTTIGPSYDPLLAKVIAWAPTRAQAVRHLAATLRRARLVGPRTNRELLVRVLEHPEFGAGRLRTDFLDRHDLTSPLADREATVLSALAADLALTEGERSALLRDVPAGWRNVPSQPRRTRFAEVEVAYQRRRDGTLAVADHPDMIVYGVTPTRVELAVDGLRWTFEVDVTTDAVFIHSALGPIRLSRVPRYPEPTSTRPGSLLAPLPGTVTRVAASTGERVSAGQPLVYVEAMKMEHEVDAPFDGVVVEVLTPVGTAVRPGDLLVVLKADSGG